MTESRLENIAEQNQRGLAKLIWTVETASGQFLLILVQCNYISLRSRLFQSLQERSSIHLESLAVTDSSFSLELTVQDKRETKTFDALVISNLEILKNPHQFFEEISQKIDDLRQLFHFPILLWFNDTLEKQGKDLESNLAHWAVSFQFTLPTPELVQSLHQGTEALFQALLTPEGVGYWRSLLFNCEIGELIIGDLGALRPLEIQFALQELVQREVTETIFVDQCAQARFEFFLGHFAYAQKEFKAALDHYQTSLDFWQVEQHFQEAGLVCFFIGLVYYHQRNTDLDLPASIYQQEQAKIAFLNCLFNLNKAQNIELFLAIIFPMGGVLRQLKAEFVLKYFIGVVDLLDHLSEKKSEAIAQAYAHLAEIALEDKRWLDGKQFAQIALENLPRLPELESEKKAYYQKLLTESEFQLDNNLVVKYIPSTLTNWQLYQETLKILKALWIEEKKYLDQLIQQEDHLLELESTLFVTPETSSSRGDQQGKRIFSFFIVLLLGMLLATVLMPLLSFGKENKVNQQNSLVPRGESMKSKCLKARWDNDYITQSRKR